MEIGGLLQRFAMQTDTACLRQKRVLTRCQKATRKHRMLFRRTANYRATPPPLCSTLRLDCWELTFSW